MIQTGALDNHGVFPEQLRHRRRRGRPRVGPTIPTSVKLPEPVFDALCQEAQHDGESLHATIVKALASHARAERPVICGSQTNAKAKRSC